jgi:hypothetical protein
VFRGRRDVIGPLTWLAGLLTPEPELIEGARVRVRGARAGSWAPAVESLEHMPELLEVFQKPESEASEELRVLVVVGRVTLLQDGAPGQAIEVRDDVALVQLENDGDSWRGWVPRAFLTLGGE